MKWCTHATGVPNWVLDPTEKVPEGFPEKVTLNWNWKDEWALAWQGKEGTMFQAEGITCTKQRTHWTENVFILLAREAREGFLQKSWLEGDECIIRFAFRKDHASAHWGLRPSGLAWRLTALLQSAAITLSREMAWWWPQPPSYSKGSAGFWTPMVCCWDCQNVRKSILSKGPVRTRKSQQPDKTKFWH